MKIYIKLALIFILVTSIKCQFPEDDEVTTAIPGYSHPIYSGTNLIINRLSRY
jgi:hypothetical protein